MKLVIFSDVHGNLPALEIMLKAAGMVDGYICLGDTVNYGPWSNECVDLILSLPNAVVLAGNHDKYFLQGYYEGTNRLARAFFDVCYDHFNRQAKLDGLKKEYDLKDFHFTHTINGRYVYPDSSVTLDKNYVIGHSHHQFRLSQPPFVLYNPGSVGQNRKYINVINYITVEIDAMDFGLHALTYNDQVVIREMKSRHYPSICIEYYEKKLRM